MIGKTILHYKIMEELGRGGMGVVYKAEDTKLGRFVALKFLPQHLTASQIEKARFLQEAKAAAVLNHPNVCVIHEIQDQAEQPFIVMEYVEGQTLRGINFGKRIDDAIGYALQIAEALQEAHSKGVVHRDIKSENIMVNSKGQIKVMDFGLAKLKGSAKLTQSSSTVGTVAYMSPEQLQGQEVDARSDIFSLGIVLYEMLTGQLPFGGDYDAAVIYSIMNEEPKPLQSRLPDAPSALLHILDRMMEKEPEDRYQTMSEILAELRRLQKHQTTITKTPASGTYPKMRRLRKPSHMRAFAWIILVILGLVAVLYGLFKFFANKEKLPFQNIRMTQITTHGKAKDAAISPDGRYAVHVMEETSGQSLWLRHLATNSDTRILTPVRNQIRGLTFSPDGGYIYYVRKEKDSEAGELYFLPVLGGVARKLLDNVSSRISFSPDAGQFAFLRLNMAEGQSALILANADGTGEKALITRKLPDFLSRFCSPAWSPDGRVIGCGESNFTDNKSRLFEINMVDGKERDLTAQKWGLIGTLAWLPSGNGLFMLGIQEWTSPNPQIWYLSYPAGRLRRITNDLNNYVSLSLTKDAKALLTVQMQRRSNIWVVPGGDASKAKQITSGRDEGSGGIAWTSDGRIVYATWDNGVAIMDSDGSRLQLLTRAYAEYPAVSADGRYIAFASAGTGGGSALYIWRMDIDGGNPKRLTDRGDTSPQFTPDGKWVIYTSLASGKVTLWKVSVEGGQPQQLTDKPSHGSVISPDGKLFACYYEDPNVPRRWVIAIFPIPGGEPTLTFNMPSGTNQNVLLRWSPDGKAITYAVDEGEISNIWSQPLDGSPPRQLTHFNDKQIFDFDWNRNGTLACARGHVENDVVLIRDVQ